MENTFEKKKNEELQAENNFLLTELKSLKESTAVNKRNFDELKETVDRLQRQLEEKEKTDKEQHNIIKRL
jgi:cell division protein FtsB